MAKDLQILAKKIGLEINGKAQVIANGSDKSLLKIKKGDKVKLLKNDNKAYEDLVVLRDGDNLIITYADGSVVTIENFYAVEDVTLELPVAQNEVHLISSNYELASSVEVIYAQGDMSKFSSIFEGNSSYLSAISNYSLAETGLSAAGEATSASGVAGFSTASLVLGGLAIAGVVAAAASGGSGGGSGSSSSPSVPVPPAPEGVDAEAVVHDGPIAGLYYEVVKTADNTVIHKGYTDIDGKFSYKNDPAYKVVFKIGDLTLADIKATDIKREIEVANKTTKVVTLQDLAKVDVTKTDDATVKKYAQLLQTLDADGNANNGIQILRDQKGNIVKLADGEEFAEENGMVTKDSYNTLSAKTLKEDAKTENVLVTKEKQGTANVSTNTVEKIVEAGVTVVNEDDAKAHLDNQLKSYYGEKATNADDLIAKLTSDGKAIVTTDLDISDKDLGEASGTVLVDDKNTSSISLTVKPEQLAKLNFAKGDKDTVTVKVLDNDKDLTANKDLTKADVLEINGKTGVVLNAAQSKALTVKDTTIGGNYKVVDSVENLLTSDPEVKIYEASVTEVEANDVVAKLGENKDISSLKLHSQVTKIDLNGAKDAVINVAQKAKVTLTGEENYSLKDTAAQIDTLITTIDKNVEITGAAKVSKLTSIKGKMASSTELKYAEVKDTATALAGADATLLAGKKVTISDDASLTQLTAIKAKVATGELVYTSVKDTYANLTSEGAKAHIRATDKLLTDDKLTVEQVITLSDKTTGSVVATLVPSRITDLVKLPDATKDGDKNELTIKLLESIANVEQLLVIASKSSNPAKIDATSVKTINGSSDKIAKLIETKINIADFAVNVSEEAVNAEEIKALDGKTTKAIDLSTVKELTGTLEDITAVFSGGVSNLNKSATKLIITDEDVKYIDLNTYLTGDYATGRAEKSIEVKALKTLEGTATEITGLYSGAEGALNKTLVFPANYQAKITGTATFENIKTLLAKTDIATIDLSAVTKITGIKLAEFVELKANAKVTAIKADVELTLTDTEINAKDIVDVKAANTTTVLDAGTVATVKGTVADILKAKALVKSTTFATNFDSKLDGVAKATDISAILDANGTGKVDIEAVTVVEGTYTEINAALTTDIDKKAESNYTAVLVKESDYSEAVTNIKNLVDTHNAKKVDTTKLKEVSGNKSDIDDLLNAESKYIFKLDKDGKKTIDVKAEDDTLEVNDINALNAATTGKITATLVDVSDIADAITKLQTTAESGDAITIRYTGTSATVQQLLDLAAKTTVKVNAEAVTTLSGTIEELTTVATKVTLKAATVNTVTLTGIEAQDEVKATDITKINALTDADVDVSLVKVVSGTKTELDAVLKSTPTKEADGLTASAYTKVIVKDETIANLSTIKDIATKNTTVTAIDISVAKTVTNATNELAKEIFVTNAGDKYVFNSAVNITIDDASKIGKDDLVALDGKTTGVITATLDDSINTLGLIKEVLDATGTNNVYKATLVAGEVAAKDYVAVKTRMGNLTDTGVTKVTADLTAGADSADNVLVALEKLGKNDIPVTFSNGEITAAQATAIYAKVSAATGILTATVADTMANFANLTVKTQSKATVTAKVSDTKVDAKELMTLAGKVNAVTLVDGVVFTTSAEDYKYLFDSANSDVEAGTGALSKKENSAVEVTNAISVADVNNIDDKTTGVVTATLSDTDLDTLRTVTDTNNNNVYTAKVVAPELNKTIALDDLKAAKDAIKNLSIEAGFEKLTVAHNKVNTLTSEIITLVKANNPEIKVQINGGAVDAAAINGIQGIAVEASVTGNVNQIKQIDAKHTLTDIKVNATGAVDVATLKAIIAKTAGNVTFNGIDTVSGSIADIASLKAAESYTLTLIGTDVNKFTVQTTAADSTVKASDLLEVVGKNGNVNGLYIDKITGGDADVKTILDKNADSGDKSIGSILESVKVDLAGESSLANINAIAAKTTGTITVETAKLETATTNLNDLLTAEDVRATTLDLENTTAQEFSITASQVLELVGAGNTLNFKLDATDKVKLDAGWTKSSEANTYKNEASNVTIKFDEAAAEVKSGETVL